eukprot:588756-Hanusia_phi.AAC.1
MYSNTVWMLLEETSFQIRNVRVLRRMRRSNEIFHWSLCRISDKLVEVSSSSPACLDLLDDCRDNVRLLGERSNFTD